MQRLFGVVLLFALMALGGGCEKKGTGITEIEPSYGNVAGGDSVIIKGHGFSTGMSVRFGKHAVKNVDVDGNNRLRVKTPSGPEGAVDVMLIDNTGKSYLLRDGFTYTSSAGK